MGTAPGASPTGAVTFCGIGSLRGIPFRVVCLIGLADTAFPRQAAVTEFDLMAERPRLGDRARRHDDRAAFLDALLSAREVLYLSYPGHNVRDDSPLPPAIPVSELLDYLGRSVAGGADAVRRRLITEHRLQPWSPHYFRGYRGEVYRTKRARCSPTPRTTRRSQRGPGPIPGPRPGRCSFIHFPSRDPSGGRWGSIGSSISFLTPSASCSGSAWASTSAPGRPSYRIRNLSARPAGRIPAGRAAPAAVPRGCRRPRDSGGRPGRQRVPHGAPGRIALRNEWRALARFRADLIRLGPTHALVNLGWMPSPSRS